MGFLQQDFVKNWLPTFNYDYFSWNQIITNYYALSMDTLVTETPSAINNQYITVPAQTSANMFMHDRNPNGRQYILHNINVSWNHRTVYQNQIQDGINQWQEVNFVVVHQNDIIPKYGDLVSNPWDQWRYFMITNVEPWIMESMYKCDIERVNYNLNVIAIDQTAVSQSAFLIATS